MPPVKKQIDAIQYKSFGVVSSWAIAAIAKKLLANRYKSDVIRFHLLFFIRNHRLILVCFYTHPTQEENKKEILRSSLTAIL